MQASKSIPSARSTLSLSSDSTVSNRNDPSKTVTTLACFQEILGAQQNKRNIREVLTKSDGGEDSEDEVKA